MERQRVPREIAVSTMSFHHFVHNYFALFGIGTSVTVALTKSDGKMMMDKTMKGRIMGS